mgnify:CR=1 FL=1
MDAQAILALLGGSSLIAVGVAIGRQLTIRRDINNIGQKVHRIEDWRNATLPKLLEETYARKDIVASELWHIRESQARMEQQLAQLVEKL